MSGENKNKQEKKALPVHCAFDKMVPVAELKPFPKNANKHPAKQIKLFSKLLRGHGWRVPITVSNQSGFIVRGHGRLLAAKKLKETEIPVDFQDYESEELERADRTADNQIAELAVIDESILAFEFDELKNADIDITLTGFMDDEIAAILGEPIAPPPPPVKINIIKGGGLEELKPSEEEHAILKGRRILVEFSGGKDSTAAAAWCRHFYPDNPLTLVFVDLGADWVGFEMHVNHSAAQLGGQLVVLRSEKNILDELLRRKEWPAWGFPWCHELLHGAIDDYVTEQPADEIVVMRGGRVREKARAATANPDRWLTIDHLPGYKYFQPLYFADKGTAERVIVASGLDLWEGYSSGLRRTACRICPGQTPSVYAAIRTNFPEVWKEFLALEEICGSGFWHDIPLGEGRGKGTISEMADHGETTIAKRASKGQ